jgi:hypothetical protein
VPAGKVFGAAEQSEALAAANPQLNDINKKVILVLSMFHFRQETGKPLN